MSAFDEMHSIDLGSFVVIGERQPQRIVYFWYRARARNLASLRLILNPDFRSIHNTGLVKSSNDACDASYGL